MDSKQPRITHIFQVFSAYSVELAYTTNGSVWQIETFPNEAKCNSRLGNLLHAHRPYLHQINREQSVRGGFDALDLYVLDTEIKNGYVDPKTAVLQRNAH